MQTGISTLNNIDKALKSVRDEIIRLDSRLSSLTVELAESERQRLRIINKIARVRLNEIDKGNLQEELTAADHEAAEILKDRDIAFEIIGTRIDELNQAISQAESEREKILALVNELAEKVAAAEGKVQDGLKHDDKYMGQLARAQKANLVAEESREKAKLAEEDFREKATPYENDKLFMYLWQRGYGTDAAQGNLITKWLDGWVAKLINYSAARVNFWNLNEIPLRLNQHARHVADKAGEEKMALQELEFAVLKKSPVPGLEKELTELRDKLDKHDGKIEELEDKLNKKLERRARFVAGEDDYIRRCLERLSAGFKHQNLLSIHRYVRETLSPTDDKLVVELQHIQNKNRDVAEDLKDARMLHDQKINRLQELEKIRREFKNHRFDDIRSGFGNESLIASMLKEFLGGIINGGQLWDVLRRSQRYRDIGSLPDFGSGGLGDLLSGGDFGNGSWHWPKPRHGGGFRIPRGGSGGGFRTGGGF